MLKGKEDHSEKRERFKRLATLRTKAVLKRLKVLGNCANRHAYSYSKEEVSRIFNTIERRLKEVRARFNHFEADDFKL